ncbi:UNVERIFIED_CONTAM: hypothetical protein FKN15_062718 [Acipenser sinensis]
MSLPLKTVPVLTLYSSLPYTGSPDPPERKKERNVCFASLTICLSVHRFLSLSETYGNVFTFHMGPKKYVVLTGYEAVKEALVTQADDFSERGQTHTTDIISKNGNGIVFGKGESWKVMRRFTLSTLRDFGMGKKTIEDQIIEESQKLVEVFQSHKGKPFDPQIIINSAVSNIICSIVFGDRFDYGDAQFLNLQRIVNESVKLGASPKTQLYNMFPFLGFFLSDHKTLQTNRIILLEYFINAYKDRKDTVDSNDLRSFIDTFISRQREEMKQQYGTPMLRRRASQPSSSCGCGSTSSWYWVGQMATVCPNSPQPGHHSSTTYLGPTSPGGRCCCCRRFCCFLQLFLPILFSLLFSTQKTKKKPKILVPPSACVLEALVIPRWTPRVAVMAERSDVMAEEGSTTTKSFVSLLALSTLAPNTHLELESCRLFITGKPFDPQIIINSAVSNIICSIVFGDRFDYGDAQFLNLQRIVNESVKLGASPKTQLYNMFPFLGFFLSDHKTLQTNRIILLEYFINAYKDCKDTVDSNDLRSFIDTFISRQREEDARNSNNYFHEDNMAITSANLFAAGTETTSTTLRWGLLLMMKYPHIQDKVQEEIESVIGRERPPQAEDRKSMPYMDAVLHEIQRVGNLLPMNLLHETTGDTTFRGYRIPKGTPVIPLLSSVLSDKTQWETPHQFNPNHFLDAQGKFVKRDAFMPFSAGQCVREEQGPEQVTIATKPSDSAENMQLSETYGNVFTFHMGPKKYVVLTGYEAVKEALVTQADDFSERGQTHTTNTSSRGGNGKRLRSPFIQNCSRNVWFTGIIFGKGESWKVMRRFTLSTLRDFGMGRKTIEDRIIEESQRLVEVFQSHEGKPFDPQIIINSAVSNVICSIVFGDRFDYGDAQFLNLQRIVNENVRLAVSPKTQGSDVTQPPYSVGIEPNLSHSFVLRRRACLGETLAKMELFLFFTVLLQKFHFRPPQEVSPDQLDLTPTPGITSGPQPFQLCALSH